MWFNTLALFNHLNLILPAVFTVLSITLQIFRLYQVGADMDITWSRSFKPEILSFQLDSTFNRMDKARFIFNGALLYSGQELYCFCVNVYIWYTTIALILSYFLVDFLQLVLKVKNPENISSIFSSVHFKPYYVYMLVLISGFVLFLNPYKFIFMLVALLFINKNGISIWLALNIKANNYISYIKKVRALI